MTKAFLGIALWAGLTGLNVWAGDTPKIQFDKTVYDFGKTSQVERVTGSFTFRNAGDGVLKLEKPTTSCGCTVASVEPDSLQPGEKGELTFTLDMPSVRSLLEKTITVNSNDPQNPKLDLKIKADYAPLFEFNPRLVRFNVRAGSQSNALVVVKRTDGKQLNITKIEASKPWITAKLNRIEKSHEQTAWVSITAKPDGPPRSIGEYVHVFVDDSEQPAVSLFVIGRVLGDIAFTPETLFWNISDPDALKKPDAEALMSRRLIATSTVPGQSFELSNLASSMPELSLKLIPQKNDTTYEIVATLTKVPAETVHGMITLDSSLASQPKIGLPVTIIVLKQTGPE